MTSNRPNPFQRASRKATYWRLALDSPSGAGKTYTALKIATVLGEHDDGGQERQRAHVAVIDTERGSAAKYSDGRPFEFDHVDLDSHDPHEFVSMMRAASEHGYPVVVVDSGSHEWKGTLGIVDRASVDMRGNTWAGWSKARPEHDSFIDAVTGHRGHVIVTYRAKQETEQYKEDGRTKVRKLGLAPVASDDMEYEFDVWGSISHDDHTVVITKSRIDTIPVGSQWPEGDGLAEAYLDWVEGKEYEAPDAPPAVAVRPPPTQPAAPRAPQPRQPERQARQVQREASPRVEANPTSEPSPEGIKTVGELLTYALNLRKFHGIEIERGAVEAALSVQNTGEIAATYSGKLDEAARKIRDAFVPTAKFEAASELVAAELSVEQVRRIEDMGEEEQAVFNGFIADGVTPVDALVAMGLDS